MNIVHNPAYAVRCPKCHRDRFCIGLAMTSTATQVTTIKTGKCWGCGYVIPALKVKKSEPSKENDVHP